MALTFAETHNMIAYLTKSDASEGFKQILDFLNASVIKRKVIITEDTVQQALRLDDANSIDCLPNEEIFAELERMGTAWNEFSSSMALAVICLATGRKFNFLKYIFDNLVRNVDSSLKFYMYPRFLHLMINAQTADLSSHTTKYTSSAFTQKVFANMRRVGKGFFGVDTPLFEGMLVPHPVNDDVVDDVVNVDVEPTPPSPTLATAPPPPQQELIPSPPYVASTLPPSPHQSPITPPSSPPQQQPTSHDATIYMDLLNKLLETCVTLTKKVSDLEQDKIAQATKITKLKQREEPSKQEGKIAKLNADDDVTLEEVAAAVTKDAKVQGRLEESQAQVYHLDLEHAQKVLSMHDDEKEPTKLTEVIEVVTTTKLMTEVVTAAATNIIAAPSAARKKMV
nr:hypothetical protein [Tanacetum cinerariifolium]